MKIADLLALLPHCGPHGVRLPCVRCVVQGSWEMHGGRGPAPPVLLRMAREKFSGLTVPLDVPEVEAPAQCPAHPEALAAACGPCLVERLRTAADPLVAVAEALAGAMVAGIALGRDRGG